MKRSGKAQNNHRRGSIKVFLVSLGCAKNLVDTEVMCGSLASSGYVLTNLPESADFMIVNTCCFIADARHESELTIRQAAGWRRAKRGRRLVVAGCWPQREGGDLQVRFPEIDCLLGLNEVPQIASHLGQMMGKPGSGPKFRPAPEADYLYDHSTPRLQLTPSTYAYVKIAEGCNHRCRFCAIPRIRGRLRSRAAGSVLEECRMLLANGVRELNFIGQDTTAYGRDRGERDGLIRLLDRCEELRGDFWLRLLYTHPRHLTGDLLDRLRSGGHLLPYLDLPLQHIDEHVLRRMGRGMGERATRRWLDKIRETCPELTVRTTFIVGYPGETEAAFAKLPELLREYRFNHVGVFTFSPEPGTAAATECEGLVEPAIGEERKALLLAEQQRVSAAINRRRVGSVAPVLVECLTPEGKWQGRTARDAPDVDGRTVFSGRGDCLKAGIVKVRITGSDSYDLTGELVAEP